MNAKANLSKKKDRIGMVFESAPQVSEASNS